VIVLDTSFLVAYHNERDQQHAKAVQGMREFLDGRWGMGLLLEYVFLEVVTVLMIRRDHAVAAHVGESLLNAAELEFVPCSDIFIETAKAFAAQRNTQLSFADMAIAVAAKAKTDYQILTFDAEFKKLPETHVYPA
jgi:predicted nucleic acid-binding protein